MNPFATVLSAGVSPKKILEFLMKKSPELAPRITKAIASGVSADKIVKFFSKDKNYEKLKQTMEQSYSTENNFNPLIQGQNIRNKNMASDLASGFQRNVGPALGTAAALGTSYALSRAIPAILQPSLTSGSSLPGVQSPLPNQGNSAIGTPAPTQQVLSQQPPIPNAPAIQTQAGTESLPQQPEVQQPEVKSIDLSKYQGFTNQIDKLLKSGNGPNEIAGYFQKFNPGQTAKLEKEFGQPIDKIIEDYISSKPEIETVKKIEPINSKVTVPEKYALPGESWLDVQKRLKTSMGESQKLIDERDSKLQDLEENQEPEIIRGDQIKYEDLPEKLYHVTTNLKGVNESGLLKRGGSNKGGLGGVAKVVSFTTDKEIAEQLKKDMLLSSELNKIIKKEGISAGYEHLKKVGKNLGFDYRELMDNPDFTKDFYNEFLKKMSGKDLLKDFFRSRNRALDIVNPIFQNEIDADPENIGIIEIDKSQIPDKNKVRTGDKFLKEAAVYSDIPLSKPIAKNETVASPLGIGEVKEIRNGKAIVDIDGKKHQVSEDELIQSPIPERELADLYDDIISGIEKHTGQQVSRNVEWAGYDPKTNELAYKPHGSDKLYAYSDISPEDIEILTNMLTQRKSTGENYIGAWVAGTTSPIGAAMYQLIQKLQKERGGKGNEYKNRYETIYDALEPAKLAKKKKYAEAKRKAKKPRSNKANVLSGRTRQEEDEEEI